MNQPEETGQTDARMEGAHPTAKKPYHKPAFRFERVFETRALACGKISSTQGQCLHNLKSS
jgi:hypothetical protein